MSRDRRHGSGEAGFGRHDGSVPWDDAEFDGESAGRPGLSGRSGRSGRDSDGVHEEPSGNGGEDWESRRGSRRGDWHRERRGRCGGDVPSDVPFYPRVRTFARRGDRMSDTLERTFEKHRHAYLLDLTRGSGVTMVAADARLDPRVVFGREAPLIVEVGCGNGEQITAAAAANPDINFLGFEVWMPGVAKAVSSAVRNYDGLPNLRLADVDALQALPILFADFASTGSRDAASVVPDDDIDAIRAVLARSRVHESPAGGADNLGLAGIPSSGDGVNPGENANGLGFAAQGVSPETANRDRFLGASAQRGFGDDGKSLPSFNRLHDVTAVPSGLRPCTAAPCDGDALGNNAAHRIGKNHESGIITELWTFFADPWPKTRHKKRRLVAPEFAGIAASLLVDGGLWRLATDWADYAWQMRDVIESTPGLENVYAGQRPDEDDPAGLRGGFAPRFEGRVRTAFERRAAREGREVRDLCARRVPR